MVGSSGTMERGGTVPQSEKEALGRAGIRIPLALKLWATVTLVIALASTLLFYELGAREHQRLVDAKVKASEMVADLLAASLAAPLDFEDQDGLKAELAHAKANPEVVWAGVFGKDGGEPLAADGDAGSASPKPGSAGTEVGAGTVVVTRSIVGRDKKPLGTSVLVFTLAPENAAFEEARVSILKLCLLLALGTSTVLFLFTRTQIVSPLGRLASAARDLERGRPHEPVDISSRDELGALAHA
ncbi:MAG TPA: HAMP domain-containing protein, partial [Polyangiaceae bacterium]|nr:HAMP domain-containing protein [Polyangiaceae bacterium]